jgi:hypothetical protein
MKIKINIIFQYLNPFSQPRFHFPSDTPAMPTLHDRPCQKGVNPLLFAAMQQINGDKNGNSKSRTNQRGQ